MAAIKAALKTFSAKNAMGCDGIPITVYKAAISVLALPLVHLVNRIIATGIWPEDWKKATVVPILKKNKPRSMPSSYRPVALLCAVSKLVERVLYNQMIGHIEERGLLPNEQHGFRSNRSVDTALATMMTTIGQQLDMGKKVGIQAFDYSAAFDLVEVGAVSRKLQWMDESARLLIINYLTGGQQRVSWNGHLSEYIAVKFGVRQGSVLGPLLFVLLTADLPEAIHNVPANSGATLENGTVAFPFLYADDTSNVCAASTWAEVEDTMESTTAAVGHFSDKNGLHLNAGKTQTLRIRAADEPTSATLDLLGISVSRNLGFDAHYATVLTDVRRRIGVIRRLRTSLSRGPLLRQIAKSLVIGKLQSCAWVTRRARPTDDDGSCSSSSHATDGAQVLLNDLARVILGVKRSDHIRQGDLATRAGIPTLNELVTHQAAINAWKAVRTTSPLSAVLTAPDPRTRGGANNLRNPVTTNSVAAVNLAKTWNASSELRVAPTIGVAKRAARALATRSRLN